MVRVKSKKKRNREKVLILLSSYNGEECKVLEQKCIVLTS